LEHPAEKKINSRWRRCGNTIGFNSNLRNV